MPKADTTPKALRPYKFHGVAFHARDDDAMEAPADCPFCGDDRGKFSINVETGVGHCFVCGVDVNATTFIRKLHETGQADDSDFETLREGRKLLTDDALRAFGLTISRSTSDWVLPGYTPGGAVEQLYRYVHIPAKGKSMLLTTSEMEHGLLGVPLFDPRKSIVYLTETWNAPALYEVLKHAKREEDGTLTLTGNEDVSLLADANVLGVPGANVFKQRWCKMFAGKYVYLMVDNDHPHGTQPGAGIAGAIRTAAMLASSAEKPEAVHFLRWGTDGEGLHNGYSASWPSGYDVRDYLSQGESMRERVVLLGGLLSMTEPIPDEWVKGRGPGAAFGSMHLEPERCTSWKELLNYWKIAMSWTDDLEQMLTVCLSSIISTETKGEQVWVLAMAPPSSGKTSICEALAVARQYVHSKSTLNKVYSGFKSDKEGSEDFSIIGELMNKTLIVMDGDAILKDPNRAQVLAQYRGLYDGVGRSHFNNGTSRNYERVRFTFIISGTASMREMDASEVGARFINVCFNDSISSEHEREVGRRVAFREWRNSGVLVNGSPKTFADEDMTEAKQRTAGYVHHLRENAEELLNVTATDADIERIPLFGEFVAFMRARKPKSQDEVVEREFSARLIAQFTRLTRCMTAVLGKKAVDAEVLLRVRRAALDTARGRTLDMVRYVVAAEERGGASIAGLAVEMGETEIKTGELLRFLKRIGVVHTVVKQQAIGITGRPKWYLTPRLRELYREVIENA